MRRKEREDKIMGTDPSEWEKVVKMGKDISEDNLEYDLLNTQWITDKTEDDVYAQNLYAALCNNKFYKEDMKEPWICSWRYAGGLIADVKWLATGKAYDYLDFYCSSALSDNPKFVAEGTVTDEVREDLTKLGWRVESYE